MTPSQGRSTHSPRHTTPDDSRPYSDDQADTACSSSANSATSPLKQTQQTRSSNSSHDDTNTDPSSSYLTWPFPMDPMLRRRHRRNCMVDRIVHHTKIFQHRGVNHRIKGRERSRTPYPFGRLGFLTAGAACENFMKATNTVQIPRQHF